MSSYSVSHPQLDITATVYAPTSEKARTTFLDYLERTGKVRRSQRQLLRKSMATKKLEEGSEGYSDLELYYEYESIPEEGIFQLEGPSGEDIEMNPEQGEYFVPSGPMAQGLSPASERVAPQQRMMPIQELALTGKVGG